MQHATDYSACVDWSYERDGLIQDAIEKRANELFNELSTDLTVMAEAWDDHTCSELTGEQVARYVKDKDLLGLFRAVSTLVNLGVAKIADQRAEKEIGA